MGGGVGSGVDSLEQTPTWAVAGVCFVLVTISIAIDRVINLLAKFFRKHHKRALNEALEKIKSELMLLGFISLLLTVGESLVTDICVPRSVADSWHPCKVQNSISGKTGGHDSDESLVSSQINAAVRRLLHNPISATNVRRILVGGGGYSKCTAKNKVQLITSKAIHQLHIFIFVLAVFHVLYCATTMALGKLKIRSWRAWEDESKTAEYESSHDPSRFRFARETSFGRRHLNFWSKSPILIWMVCFFRQFVRSVPKVDYLTLRHGFIMAHLAPHSTSKFNFQKYIKRSLEDDFKVVVEISPPIWFFAVLFLLFNTHGWDPYLWLPFIPLIIILLVGTKLQVVIIRMALQITEHGGVVKGIPVVHPTDELFWFKRPHLILHLIHFVLFQNAFQLAFFVWSCYEFGYPSCFHKRIEDIIIRISMGLLIHILCSYVTLPLYALVTQMGTNMKPTIFTERVATALRKWHETARKHLKKDNHPSGGVTPLSTSRPTTPTGRLSPVHLLRRLRSEIDSPQFSPRTRNFDIDHLDLEGSPLPNRLTVNDSSSHHNTNKPQQGLAGSKIELQPMEEIKAQHGNTVSTDFTFNSGRR